MTKYLFLGLALLAMTQHIQGKWDIFDIAGILGVFLALVAWAIEQDWASPKP